jgi:lipopolysaccharide export system protein LptA
MVYGPKNTLETARSVNVTTRTENPKKPDEKTAPPPALTSSKNLLATFQPNSSQLAKLEQWDQFKYEQGDRHAKADRALLDQPKNIITLVNGARVWDGTGYTDATTIVMDQKNGDIDAEGNVDSFRMPDKKDDDTNGTVNGTSSMLSNDQPMHARATKMVSTEKNHHLKYEGNAVLWQGANRIQGDFVEIDRDKSTLSAHGRVVSQLVDKAKDDPDEKDAKAETHAASNAATKAAAPVFTIVKAPELVYDDNQRLAHYKGGAALTRPNMQVKAQEIRAFLRQSGSSPNRAAAYAKWSV